MLGCWAIRRRRALPALNGGRDTAQTPTFRRPAAHGGGQRRPSPPSCCQRRPGLQSTRPPVPAGSGGTAAQTWQGWVTGVVSALPFPAQGGHSISRERAREPQEEGAGRRFLPCTVNSHF